MLGFSPWGQRTSRCRANWNGRWQQTKQQTKTACFPSLRMQQGAGGGRTKQSNRRNKRMVSGEFSRGQMPVGWGRKQKTGQKSVDSELGGGGEGPTIEQGRSKEWSVGGIHALRTSAAMLFAIRLKRTSAVICCISVHRRRVNAV